MVARSVLVLKVTVLSMALLVVIGSWEIYRGAEALAQLTTVPFPSADFKCYVINHGIAPKETVTLDDQFTTATDPQQVVVREPQILCAPVTKTRDGVDPLLIVDEAGPHLKCYNITPAGPPVNETRQLCDQFHPCEVASDGTVVGGELVKVQTAQYLCTLACKDPTTVFPGCLTPTP